MDEAKKLDVYCADKLVGQLIDGVQLKFIYSDSWINNQNHSISPLLLTAKKEYEGLSVEAFFENLLPEAGIRELLKLKYQVSSTFGLLSVVGGDTASDLAILAEGQQPNKPEYQKMEWLDVHASFKNQQGVIATAREKKSIRISLAGAQRKMGIVIRSEKLFLPLGNSP
jgi:serine/threonine-protein kinase HipA